MKNKLIQTRVCQRKLNNKKGEKMEKIFLSLLTALFLIFNVCDAGTIRLKDGTEIEAIPMPEHMTDFRKVNNADDNALSFTDVRSKMMEIVSLDGNILMKAVCKDIIYDGIDEYFCSFTGERTGKNVCAINLLDYTIDRNNCGGISGRSFGELNTYMTDDGRIVTSDPDGLQYNGGYEVVASPISNKVGTVNKKGQILIPFEYDYIGVYTDELALVATGYCDSQRRYGYADLQGNIAIPVQFVEASNFEEGYAVVKNSIKNNYIIEKDGFSPFEVNFWKTVFRVNNRIFIGEDHYGKWYHFEMPESTKTSVIVTKSKHQTIQDYLNSYSEKNGRMIGNCSLRSHVIPGRYVHVITDTGIKIRNTPGGTETGFQAYAKDESGKVINFYVYEDEPQCVKNIVWYKINFLGRIGWVAEGTNGEYFLEKADR